MARPKWLDVLEQVGPIVIALSPLAPIAPAVVAGIRAAEAIPGATSSQKKAKTMEIVSAAVQGANAQAGKVVVDPNEAMLAADNAIDTIVHVTNVIHRNPVAIVPGL